LPEPSAYLVVALSGRALTSAARCGGRIAHALDLFGDTDTRAHAARSEIVAGSLAEGFDAAALLAAAERLAPAGSSPQFGLVYGSGLEDRPELLAALSQGRRLYGNSPDTVGLTKDPRVFFAALARLGIPCPETAFAAPADPAGWLMKRIGASGGNHVVPAASATSDGPDRYYQRRMPGRPVGVSFLANGKRAVLLGFSEQWAWPAARGSSFLFGGALQPATIDDGIVRDVPGLLDALTAEFGLVGLNSLDMLVDGDRYAVIEVNPRPGANLDLFDDIAGTPLFELHLLACDGRLPDRIVAAAPEATAMAVVYADRPCTVPADIGWPDWVADRPAPGAGIEAGAPVCTVLARAPAAGQVRALADRRADMVLSWLQTPAPGSRPVPADAALNG
jgi:predicted ATP-grasp superfamily ATP-dependent carboligase